MRIGQGFDVHRFVAPGASGPSGPSGVVSESAARPLMLGGVVIPDAVALEGHSDADVVLHAVVDALLGAAALGDLGTRFGTDDPAYANAASSVFVAEAMRLVRETGWTVSNIDCTIVAQRPRIGPHRAAITARLAGLLSLTDDAVSVKATTTDGLGLIGRGEGIACLAVVLLHHLGPRREKVATVESRMTRSRQRDQPSM